MNSKKSLVNVGWNLGELNLWVMVRGSLFGELMLDCGQVSGVD